MSLRICEDQKRESEPISHGPDKAAFEHTQARPEAGSRGQRPWERRKHKSIGKS